MTTKDLLDLQQTIDAIVADSELRDDTQHAKRLVLVTAVLSEAFRRHDCRATLVGGGAIEFYAPSAYATDDIDLVVEGLGQPLDRGVLNKVFTALGFKKLPARHWARDDLFVEVPGTLLEDPIEEAQVGPYRLRVVAKEAVIVGRIVEFDQTGNLPHAKQAILLLQGLGSRLDQALLSELLRRERAAEAYELLRAFADRPETAVTDEALIEARERLHGRFVELRERSEDATLQQKPRRRKPRN